MHASSRPGGSRRAARVCGWCAGAAAALLALFAQLALAEPVTLNFKDADIGAVITSVSEMTGKNFIVDPRVKGRITVVSSHPMSREETYHVFLAILQVHGFAAVPTEAGIIKIIPDAAAKQDSTPVLADANSGRGDEIATRVIQVENVSAAQLVPILRPLVPQQGHLAAYPPTNVLVISDRAANIERLVQIIQGIDRASNEEVDVVALRHASASEVVRTLTALEQRGAKAAEPVTESIQLVADERTNSILMSGGRAARMRLHALIAQLDTPLESGGNTHVVYLRYAQAADLVPVLKGVGASADAEAQAQSTKASSFDVQADPSTNALIITAPPDILRTLRSVIAQLDIRRAQVLVEAIIAEMATDRASELGVQWVIDGTPGSHGPVAVTNFGPPGSSIGSIAAAAASRDPRAVAGLPAGLTLGVGRFNHPSFNFAALIRALASDAASNILSTPSLVTMDNEEAEIVVGQNVPFVTGQFTSSGTTTSAVHPFQTIQRQDVGLTLRVRPQINEGSAIRLDIEQEVSSIAASVTGAADIITNRRSIRTSVLIESGQVLVLGGLIDDNLHETEQRVPGLGSLPLLGGLFRYNKTTKLKRNLMVFMHPVILRDEHAAAIHSRSKYDFIRAEQLERAQRPTQLIPDAQVPVLPDWDDALAFPPSLEDLVGMEGAGAHEY
jgi:general secretion pathway protein D